MRLQDFLPYTQTITSSLPFWGRICCFQPLLLSKLKRFKRHFLNCSANSRLTPLCQKRCRWSLNYFRPDAVLKLSVPLFFLPSLKAFKRQLLGCIVCVCQFMPPGSNVLTSLVIIGWNGTVTDFWNRLTVALNPYRNLLTMI